MQHHLMDTMSRNPTPEAEPSVPALTRGQPMTLADSACAACGATSDLVDNPEVEITFCRACLDHTRGPEVLGDEMYYTIGGEG